MSRPPANPVHFRTRAFIKGLGKLSARNEAIAAAAERIALLLDGETAGSAATALGRELRQLLLVLEPNRSNVPAPAPETVQARQDSAAATVAAAQTDPVAAARDDLARRRSQRGRSA